MSPYKFKVTLRALLTLLVASCQPACHLLIGKHDGSQVPSADCDPPKARVAAMQQQHCPYVTAALPFYDSSVVFLLSLHLSAVSPNLPLVGLTFLCVQVWAVPPKEMQCEWLGERVATVDVDRAITNVIHNKEDAGWGPNAVFRFPLEGGTGGIWKGVAKLLPQRHQVCCPLCWMMFLP